MRPLNNPAVPAALAGCLVASLAGAAWAEERRTEVMERRYVVERPIDGTDVDDSETYIVRRPVVETVEREEVVKVRRPIVETVDREETYTVRRPVIETSEREEVYTVRKPVYETVEEDRVHVVRRPIYETAEREELVTEYVPTTSCVRSYSGNGLWMDSPQTTFAARVVARRVPIQTVRYVDEQQVQRVPVQRVRYVEEQRVRRVPVESVRYVEERHVRKVPVERLRYIEEEEVRKVPVEVRRYIEEVRRPARVIEERTERIPGDEPRSTYAEGAEESDREAEVTPKPRLTPSPDQGSAVPLEKRKSSGTSLGRNKSAVIEPANLAGPLVPVAWPDRLAQRPRH